MESHRSKRPVRYLLRDGLSADHVSNYIGSNFCPHIWTNISSGRTELGPGYHGNFSIFNPRQQEDLAMHKLWRAATPW